MVANLKMERAIYLHRSCLPLIEADLGGRELTGGVADSECEGLCEQ